MLGWFVLLVTLIVLGGFSWANAWTGYMPYYSRGDETYDYLGNKRIREDAGVRFVDFGPASRITFGVLAVLSLLGAILAVNGLMAAIV